MPTAAKSDPADDRPVAPTPPTDPFAWDPDPLVVVSRRGRIVMFPADLLREEPSDEQVKSWTTWKETRAEERDEKQLVFHPGVNFVACRTSAFHYLHHAANVVAGSTAPPPPDALRTVALATTGADLLAGPMSGNLDRDTGKVRPDRLRAAFERVLAFLQTHRAPRSPDLWNPPNGFDAPELMLLPLSEVLTGKTEQGQQAKNIVETTLQSFRRTNDAALIVGALHDYAIRSRPAANIMAECRRWAQRKQVRA